MRVNTIRHSAWLAWRDADIARVVGRDDCGAFRLVELVRVALL